MRIFQAVVLVCICYIGLMAGMSANSIVKSTPVYDTNDTLLVNQSNQTDAFIDLGWSLAPGLLLLIVGYIVVKAISGGGA